MIWKVCIPSLKAEWTIGNNDVKRAVHRTALKLYPLSHIKNNYNIKKHSIYVFIT